MGKGFLKAQLGSVALAHQFFCVTFVTFFVWSANFGSLLLLGIGYINTVSTNLKTQWVYLCVFVCAFVRVFNMGRFICGGAADLMAHTLV